jgi:DNA modification methylase
MKAKLVPIKSIKTNPKNPRVIRDEKFQKLVKSIQEFPKMLDLRPIVVNKSMMVLGGNQRLKACIEAGLKEVPILIADELTKAEQERFIITDNVNFGDWDFSDLNANWNLESLENWGLDIDFGLEEEKVEAKEDDYEIPEEIKTDIVIGDLFEIGNHRLLCGDSTDKEQVEKLMNGEKAGMVFTSPPYNANMNMISYEKGKVKSTPFYENNETDNKTSKEFIDFLSSVLNNCILNTDGWIFWNIGYNANSRSEWIENTYQFKDYLQETIIWKKSTAMPVKYGFTRIIEFIFLYTTKGNKIHINKESETIQNYWEVSNNNSSIENHKACFPIELVRKALNINSENKLILEPFCGSGSTMVASHQLKRKCYGMELDPKYCQVIIDRMLKLDPTLEIKKNGKKYVGIKKTK